MNAKGMNWIRQEKRLAVYLRDGLACCWCGAAVEDGAQLTLDHCRPRERGGSNEATNLVTACFRCNSARQNRGVTSFARAVAEYLNGGVDARDVVRHVRRQKGKVLDLAAAKELVARRGSAAKAVKYMSRNGTR